MGIVVQLKNQINNSYSDLKNAVDEKLVLYSWTQGEDDIEWYHGINSSFIARKPLIEA